MLVLTRKPNQQIRIGDSITVSVIKVRGNTIRLGIEAPKNVRVMRAEILEEENVPPTLCKEVHQIVEQS